MHDFGKQVFQEIRPLVGRHNNGNAPFGWIRSSMQSEDHLNTTPASSENAPRSNDIEAADNVSISVEGPSYARQSSTSSAPARSDSTEVGSVHEVIDSATTATTATSNVISQSRASLHQNNNGSYESSTSATTNGNNENDQANENDSLAQIPEARAFINTVSRYFPYVCILFAKSCYDHLDGKYRIVGVQIANNSFLYIFFDRHLEHFRLTRRVHTFELHPENRNHGSATPPLSDSRTIIYCDSCSDYRVHS